MAEDNKTAGAPAPATLEEQVATLTKENAALKSELSDAAKVVEELKEKLADSKGSGLTVTVNKKKYAVVGGGYHKGKAYTKDDIAADAKIAAELIAKGSQLLIEKK